jgi:hypothetical protein
MFYKQEDNYGQSEAKPQEPVEDVDKVLQMDLAKIEEVECSEQLYESIFNYVKQGGLASVQEVFLPQQELRHQLPH